MSRFVVVLKKQIASKASSLLAGWLSICFVGIASAQTQQPLTVPRASITPSELGVVIAEGDPVSEAVGTYYAAVRGIPPENIVRIPIPTTSDVISAAAFKPLKALADARLPERVQATVLTWARPSRVVEACGMSITSAFAFGYDAKYCGGCSATQASPYYNTGTTKPWPDFKMRPSMLLPSASFAEAKLLIDRGVLSDASYPGGDGYLVRTNDVARSSPRYSDFASLPAAWNYSEGLKFNYIDNSSGTGSNSLTGKTDVLFYFTGLANVPGVASNTYRPGAIADHLTSFGGALPDGYGQMPVTAWLNAGVTGSYGTVEEPCAYRQKFPQASVVIDQYFRGATLIEAYWKSVQWPGQGLFVGEPLAQPFRDLPSSTVQGNEFVMTTRALARNSRYAVDYRASPSSPWQLLSEFEVDVPKTRSVHVPLPPIANAETRVQGPCPRGDKLSSYPGPTAYQQVAGGRAQSVVYQVSMVNFSGDACAIDRNVDLSVDVTLNGNPQQDGLTVRVAQSALELPLDDERNVAVQIDIPATAAPMTPTGRPGRYDVRMTFRNRVTGQIDHTQSASIAVLPPTSSDPVVSAPLRVVQPADNWVLVGPQGGAVETMTGQYSIPVQADVKPGSGITRVRFVLEGGGKRYETIAAGPSFSSEIVPWYMYGNYNELTMTVTGENSLGATVGEPISFLVYSRVSVYD